MSNNKSFEERADLYVKQIKAGLYLNELRTGANLTLAAVAKKIGISVNYLSELERGVKPSPSDTVIRELAKVYRIEEELIFLAYGKVPLVAREFLEQNPGLQKALTEIGKNPKLSDEKRERLTEELMTLYRKLLES